MTSPYKDQPEDKWYEITEELITKHPLTKNDIIDAVLEAWEGIMETSIAGKLKIGVDIFPTPQILGNYLHELIPIILEKKYPGLWTRDSNKKDKDLVYVKDPYFSCEIKTSSNKNNIYGNASYGQEDSASSTSKSKDGYYIAINFENLIQVIQLLNLVFVKYVLDGWIILIGIHRELHLANKQVFVQMSEIIN